MEERAERLAQLEQFEMVEEDFVKVDPEMEERRKQEAEEEERMRLKGLNRQIEEAVYNIKPQDYNEKGELIEEAVPENAEIIEHNFPDHGSPDKKIDSPITHGNPHLGEVGTPDSFVMVERKEMTPPDG